jgi:PilZ domain
MPDEASGLVGQVVKLNGALLEELCLVQKAVGHYLTVQIYLPLTSGTVVQLQTLSRSIITASVHSQAGSIALLHCERAVENYPAHDFLSLRQPASSMSKLRPSLNLGVRISVAGEERPAVLVNLSPGGAKITGLDLARGTKVRLCAGGLPPIPGRVRWTKERDAGLSFFTPIDSDELSYWTGSVLRHFPV